MSRWVLLPRQKGSQQELDLPMLSLLLYIYGRSLKSGKRLHLYILGIVVSLTGDAMKDKLEEMESIDYFHETSEDTWSRGIMFKIKNQTCWRSSLTGQGRKPSPGEKSPKVKFISCPNLLLIKLAFGSSTRDLDTRLKVNTSNQQNSDLFQPPRSLPEESILLFIQLTNSLCTDFFLREGGRLYIGNSPRINKKRNSFRRKSSPPPPYSPPIKTCVTDLFKIVWDKIRSKRFQNYFIWLVYLNFTCNLLFKLKPFCHVSHTEINLLLVLAIEVQLWWCGKKSNFLNIFLRLEFKVNTLEECKKKPTDTDKEIFLKILNNDTANEVIKWRFSDTL